jgi:reverse gyrase
LQRKHEECIAHLIKKLGDDASLVYSKPKPYAKKKWSTVRYDLIIEVTTVADQVRRVYWHYAQKDALETALKEAAKVKRDLVWDRDEKKGRRFYALLSSRFGHKAKS